MKKLPILVLASLVLSIFAVGLADAYGYNDPYENTDVEKYYRKTTDYNYFPGGYEKITSKTTTSKKTYTSPFYHFPRTNPSYSYLGSHYGFGSNPSYSRYNYPRERYYDDYYYKPIRHPSGSYYWRY